MRKYDYEVLAKIIKSEMHDVLVIRDALTPRVADQRILQCKRIAKEFANSSHVDKEKFLAACGVEKD